MLKVFVPGDNVQRTIDIAAGEAIPAGAVWLDMAEPTLAEDKAVEVRLGVSIPTREDIVEIEPSARLYRAGETLYLTASLLAGVDAGTPTIVPVSFVLTPVALVTVRYAEPPVFNLFGAQAERTPLLCADATRALANLLEAIVDRLADKLELVGHDIDLISAQAFRRAPGNRQQRMSNLALQALLSRIGRAQDTVSKARHSAVSLERLLGYLAFAMKGNGQGVREQLKSVARDVTYLSGYTGYLVDNITFLLDAALGLISVEQNAIIKIFSVAAVIFLPPTLVASIYGMNFERMPELQWTYGYPFAIGVMVLAAVLPYLFFKRKGWL